jgi:hypothetical protein
MSGGFGDHAAALLADHVSASEQRRLVARMDAVMNLAGR